MICITNTQNYILHNHIFTIDIKTIVKNNTVYNMDDVNEEKKEIDYLQ